MSDTKRIERFLLRNTRDIGYNVSAMFVTRKPASKKNIVQHNTASQPDIYCISMIYRARKNGLYVVW